VTEITIRPTTKFLKAGTGLAVAAVVGLEVAIMTVLADTKTSWVQLVPLLLLLWPAVLWLRRQFTKTVLAGDRLRSESGITSRSTRIIQLSKVQDVRVDQGLIQRLFGVGDVSIETAGETSRLSIINVDQPHQVAEQVMTASQKGHTSA
jgi:uncharacterized membrane protein YdbT with pleckstrin-like domain